MQKSVWIVRWLERIRWKTQVRCPPSPGESTVSTSPTPLCQAAVDQLLEEPRRVLQGQRLPPARQDAFLWRRACWGRRGAQRVLSYSRAGCQPVRQPPHYFPRWRIRISWAPPWSFRACSPAAATSPKSTTPPPPPATCSWSLMKRSHPSKHSFLWAANVLQSELKWNPLCSMIIGHHLCSPCSAKVIICVLNVFPEQTSRQMSAIVWCPDEMPLCPDGMPDCSPTSRLAKLWSPWGRRLGKVSLPCAPWCHPSHNAICQWCHLIGSVLVRPPHDLMTDGSNRKWLRTWEQNFELNICAIILDKSSRTLISLGITATCLFTLIEQNSQHWQIADHWRMWQYLRRMSSSILRSTSSFLWHLTLMPSSRGNVYEQWNELLPGPAPKGGKA